MNKSYIILCFLLCVVISYTSCKKEYSCENCNQHNQPPIADAGPDKIIILSTDSSTLNGSSSSDADGSITSYAWRKITGPASSLFTPSSAVKTSVKNLVAGLYNIELKVTDDGGLIATDTMRIIVNDPAQINQPPVAIAGEDQQITLPINIASLDGSASHDPDNNITGYAWSKIFGPSSYSISKVDSPQTQVTALTEGVYQFQLNVIDADGLFSTDTVQIRVNNTTQTLCPFQQTLIGTLYPYRYGIQTATAGSKIVFAGGWETSPTIGPVPSTKVDIYDIRTQSWSSFNLMNHGGHVAIIAAGDKIFFAGGISINPTVDASLIIDIYNTTDNTWTTAQLSEARNGISAAKAGDKVLFAGGMTPTGASTTVDMYDLTTSTWSTANLSQATIYSHNAVSLGDKAIFQNVTGVDIYNASTNIWSTFEWGGAYIHRSTAISGNKIYLAGGYDGGYSGNNFSDVVHIYDVVTNFWSSTKMSQPKALMASIGSGEKIIWAGGIDSIWRNGFEDNGRNVQDIETYDVNTGNHSHHFIPRETYFSSVGVANNYVLFFTGVDGIHVYNTDLDLWTICDAEIGWNPVSIAVGNEIYVAAPVGSQPTNLSVWKLEF